MRIRVLLACAITTAGLLVSPALASGCSLARAQSGRNPSYTQVAAAIDASAGRHRVPPPLMRAIAWKESGWAQFWPDGRAKVSGDCGIGIMQITGGSWDYRRLATDYAYNIDAGAAVLAAKMRASSANVPQALRPDDPRVFENWYRATYRYNGAGYNAERYADSVFGMVVAPPSPIRPWSPPVAVANPKSVLRGYRPTSAHAYVVRPDGVWRSTLGTVRGPFQRADYLAAYARMAPGRTLEGDQQAWTSLTARNIGYATWTPWAVVASPWPYGRASLLRSPLWTNSVVAAKLRADVRPGGTGTWNIHAQAARLGASRTVDEFFSVTFGGVPVGGGRGSGRWTLHPAVAPTASLASAPRYVTDGSTDSSAVVTVSASDPGTGAAGVRRVEAVTRPCPTCDWSAVAQSTGRTLRLAMPGAGIHDVRVRAIDNAGHASPWTEPRPVVVPRDDTASELVYDRAWTTEPAHGSWLGTVTTATEAGAALETRATATRFAVIGTRAPDAAAFAVYLDGELAGVVEPVAESTQPRQVLAEFDAPPGEHVLRVEVLAGNGTARIDAIAAT